MAIKITSDSTCDLTPELLDRYQITLAPLYVTLDGVTRKDGVDIHPQDIFHHVAAGGGLPSTSAVNIADYQELFSRYARQFEAVIHFNIGQEFSACHQNAVIAAEDFDNVYVIDSRNLTMGQGLLVLEAAEAAQQGQSPQDIVAHIHSLIEKVSTTFVVDRLDYLAKGGRCSSVVALGANLLKLKPCIVLADGKMSVGKKYRGVFDKVLPDYVRDQLDPGDFRKQRCVIVNAGCKPETIAAVRCVVEEYGFQEIIEGDAGCTISAHCGPNTLGILFLRQ